MSNSTWLLDTTRMVLPNMKWTLLVGPSTVVHVWLNLSLSCTTCHKPLVAVHTSIWFCPWPCQQLRVILWVWHDPTTVRPGDFIPSCGSPSDAARHGWYCWVLGEVLGMAWGAGMCPCCSSCCYSWPSASDCEFWISEPWVWLFSLWIQCVT